MLIGSCFAEHVGLRLQQRMGERQADVNPFGVLYNPISISNAISMILDGEDATSYIFKGRDNFYHSWMHTSHFSGSSYEECRDKIQQRLLEATANLRRANLLCITFGTTRCYRLKDSNEGLVVANCHKEPQSCFSEYEPSLEELTETWIHTLRRLRDINPTLRICFTVSPYRYRKYGFHESQIQKAKLLLLVDALCRQEQALYFPAYEIMMDELRDYRFYATDMLHPSDLAVDIITERFIEWTFTPQLKETAKTNLKAWKQSQHRTLIDKQ